MAARTSGPWPLSAESSKSRSYSIELVDPETQYWDAIAWFDDVEALLESEEINEALQNSLVFRVLRTETTVSIDTVILASTEGSPA